MPAAENSRTIPNSSFAIPLLYSLSLVLGVTSVILVALDTELSLVPLAVGAFLVTMVGRNAFARKWAAAYFLLLVPMIVTVIVILAGRR